MAKKNYYSHETAFIDQGCKIGANTKIWHFSHIMPNCIIGKKCNIGQNVVISPEVILGSNVKVQNNVSILAPFFTIVLRNSSFLFTALLGLITFVKTIEGPKKTSSSQMTPVYIDTLF